MSRPGNVKSELQRTNEALWKRLNKERLAAQRRRYRETHGERERENQKRHALRLKIAAFEAYGGSRCQCCGENNPAFLTLDHIANDGADHRRYINGVRGQNTKHHGYSSGRNFYQLLKKQGYPPGVRVLCFNCNCGRYVNGGTCPHEQVQEESIDQQCDLPLLSIR